MKEALRLTKDQYSLRLTKILQLGLQILLNRLQTNPTEVDKDFVDMTGEIHEIASNIRILNIDYENQLELEEAYKRLDKQEREFNERSNKDTQI
jgi:hypothetical protein